MSQQLLLEATTQASRALEKDGIGYRVIGGQAVTMLGGGRVTEVSALSASR